ncbi:class III lanthionine synthetase LanKC [Kutzneria viridogrisea]|uniref:class III lanthionine synthetase LanKC n=2 Tax=Kutzneria viridogrisea TaxID=47990 RepID=UPI001600AF5F
MDMRYEAYCLADPLFYDRTGRSDSERVAFRFGRKPVPAGWEKHEVGLWTALKPTGATGPGQGWKIHVSATLENCERVLELTAEYCIRRQIPFKFLQNRTVLVAQNSKYAKRSSSGKLLTIYPSGEAQLQVVIDELSELLSGEQGPYILSDLRCGTGPLYVRYGGFTQRLCPGPNGELVLAIENAEGTLVPDERRPVFSVPEWISVPDFLQPHIEARKGNGDTLPYQVKSPLHFSNGGGVYLARRLVDDQQVVLKEARPFAGLDAEGTDAVTRLHRERDALRTLAGIPGVPRLYEDFTVWEHHFLAMQHMPGGTLGAWQAANYPLVDPRPGEAEVAGYRGRALAILAQVERIIGAIHERGLVFGDLHPNNVLVDDEDRVSLIDFELAFDAELKRRPALGAPGFAAPAGRVGREVDLHALQALRLFLFLPLNRMLLLAPEKLDHYVSVAGARFGLPAGELDEVRTTLYRDNPRAAEHGANTLLDEEKPDWSAVRSSLVRAILASATPQREDRLFPGDIEAFTSGGTTFAHGAAGVLHTLAAVGAGRFPEYEQWLIDAVRREAPRRPGFFNGAHGVVHVLEQFGHSELADELLAEYTPVLHTVHDHSLFGGLSGIALNLLDLADRRRDNDFRDQALLLGQRLADKLSLAAPPGPRGRAGLCAGWSGPALLFVRLFERTGEPEWLRLADSALLRDLDECVQRPNGTVQVRDGGLRTLPYLEVGSAGIALVLGELSDHLPEARSVESLPGLHTALLPEFVIFPGLLAGRAGVLATLHRARQRTPDAELDAAVSTHLRRLGWHSVSYQGELAFPGTELLRLSMDLATGTAGVLRVLAGIQDGHGAFLPFLRDQRQPVKREVPLLQG